MGKTTTRTSGWRHRDHEKAFFCQAARKACSVKAEDGTSLVERTCLDNSPCDQGDSGVVQLGQDRYTITFCGTPSTPVDPILKLINRGRQEELSAALAALCPHSQRPQPPRPYWFMFACQVTDAAGQELKPSRPCYGDHTCTKGPYYVEYQGDNVTATFCNYG